MSGLAERSARWMYRGLWAVLVDWFRVPREPPTLPAGPGDSLNSFQPAEGFLLYLKFWFWIVLFAIDIALFIGWVAACIALWMNELWWVALIITPPIWIIIVVPDMLAWVAIHLRYDTTWYVMTDRSLRIRRGVWSIHEVTVTFENVQNIRLRSGPVQRHYGIADLMVETAGGGSAPGKGGGDATAHKAIIEGVANAAELRDRILARLRQSKTAGLGDEGHSIEHDAGGGRWTPAHLDVLREIREAARALAS